MKRYKVIKGDSTLNLKIVVENYPALDENWVCTQTLLTSISTEVEPSFFANAPKRIDDSAFDVHLTPSNTLDSNLLEGETYFWQVVVTNTSMSPPYSKTFINKLEIEYRG